MKILVAVDGSRTCKNAITYLTTHFSMLGTDSKVTLITVHAPIPPHAAHTLGHAMTQSYYDDEAEKALKPVRAALGKAGITAKEVTVVGDPGDEISTLATKGKFDLVLMGSHGHGVFKNLVMGSVATKVLAGCKVPVLLVR